MGTQFESNLFQTLCHKLGIDKRRTTPYHPQTNGAVERMHRTLGSVLRCLAADNKQSWADNLQAAAMSLRNTLCVATKHPPSSLVLGAPIRIPAEAMAATTNSATAPIGIDLQPLQDIAQRSAYPEQNSQAIQTGDYVWLHEETRRGKLAAPYTGPFLVVKSTTQQNHAVIQINGKQATISKYRLKKARMLPEIAVPLPDDNSQLEYDLQPSSSTHLPDAAAPRPQPQAPPQPPPPSLSPQSRPTVTPTPPNHQPLRRSTRQRRVSINPNFVYYA
jgi:hypothetical protein